MKKGKSRNEGTYLCIYVCL